MSKTKALKRSRHLAAPPPTGTAPVAALNTTPQPAEAPRGGFSMTIVFDPFKPEQVRYDVLASGEATPRDGDILSALLMTRDDILIKSAVALAQQQQQAQAPAPVQQPSQVAPQKTD